MVASRCPGVSLAEENMSKFVLGTLALVAIAGCGGSFPPPSEKLSSAEAASRSAPASASRVGLPERV